MPVEDLRQSPMMAHMLDALDDGEDIGHYGRLVFAMIGRHFVSNDELVELLTKDHDADPALRQTETTPQPAGLLSARAYTVSCAISWMPPMNWRA